MDLSSYIQRQAEYVHNPTKWAYDMLRFEPDKWQQEAWDDYVNHRFCAWSTGSGVGKTAQVAVTILHFLATRPFPKIPCTAPSQHQLFDVLWAEISKWLRRSELLSNMFVWTQQKVALKGHEEEWFAVARTSRPRPGQKTAEGLQGFHSDHLLFVVDECSGVPDQILGAMDGAHTTHGTHAILASNPTRNTGYFYRATHDPKLVYHPVTNPTGVWRVRFVSAKDAKHVDSTAVTRIATIYGEDSDYYRMRVLGLAPRTESNALCTPEQMYAAHLRNEEFEDGDVYMSCDPARFGNDDTLYYVRRGNRIIHRTAVHGMDTTQVTDTGIKIYREFAPIKEYRIDEIGIGAGVIDQTKKDLGPLKNTVRGVHVGETAIKEEEFYNLRAEIAWNVRTAIDHVSIPFETELLDEECTQLRYGWDSKDKRIKLQSKDEFKNEFHRSPNDFDAFALLMMDFKKLIASVSAKVFSIGSRSTSGDTGLLRNIAFNDTKDPQRNHRHNPNNIVAFKTKVGSGRYSEFGSIQKLN